MCLRTKSKKRNNTSNFACTHYTTLGSPMRRSIYDAFKIPKNSDLKTLEEQQSLKMSRQSKTS